MHFAYQTVTLCKNAFYEFICLQAMWNLGALLPSLSPHLLNPQRKKYDEKKKKKDKLEEHHTGTEKNSPYCDNLKN